jgi:kynurenine 3-monooxygenase
MRSTVLSPLHHLRRHLDAFLTKILPRPASTSQLGLSLTDPFPTRKVKGWTSLYEMVTFRPDVGYAEALRRERWQKDVLGWGVWVGGAGLVGLVGAGTIAALRFSRASR